MEDDQTQAPVTDTTPVVGEDIVVSPDTPVEAQPPAEVVPAVPDMSQRIEAGISKWWQSHIHGSPLGQSTEAYNHLTTVRTALREFIQREFE